MKLKNKYNLLAFLYYIAWCTIGGFVAVILKDKGVSNTLIGIVTASGCVSSIFLAPYLSTLVTESDKLSIKKVLTIVFTILMILFTLINFVKIPVICVVIFYILINALLISVGPFLQTLASSYMQAGYDVNFGFARGLGSVSWAITALIFGFFIDMFSSSVLGIGFVISAILTLLVLNTLPEVSKFKGGKKKGGSPFTIVKKYKVYFFLLLGFSFCLSAASSIGTYLIDIVKSLGGSESFYGIAVFIMAFSEMPVMAISPWLMKKYKTIDLIVVGALCYVIRNITMCLAPNLPILCIGMIFQGFSFGLFTAVITYYVIYNIDVEDQAMGQTMITVMNSGFGSTIGNLLGGILQDMFGLTGMYAFIISCTIIGFVVVCYGKWLSKKPQYSNEIKR